MLDFACKQFDINEIIKCAIGLTRAEIKIFNFFLKHSSCFYKTDDISKKINLNITTIQKAVKKLNEKNVIIRNQKNFLKGGYIFLYKLNDKKIVKQILIKIIRRWSCKVEEEVKRI